MGQSVAFVYALLAFSTLFLLFVTYRAVDGSVGRIADAVELKGTYMKAALEEDFVISNSFVEGTQEAHNITITLNNTGSLPIRTSTLTFLYDGVPLPLPQHTVLMPLRATNITFTNLQANGTVHSLCVVSATGGRAYGRIVVNP